VLNRISRSGGDFNEDLVERRRRIEARDSRCFHRWLSLGTRFVDTA